jgi:hypothetical protein
MRGGGSSTLLSLRSLAATLVALEVDLEPSTHRVVVLVLEVLEGEGVGVDEVLLSQRALSIALSVCVRSCSSPSVVVLVDELAVWTPDWLKVVEVLMALAKSNWCCISLMSISWACCSSLRASRSERRSNSAA